jgi:S1-C subfamily serine protease
MPVELAHYDGPLFPALGDGGWGYISSRGEFVIPPQFIGARPFSEGLAAVYVGGTLDAGSRDPGTSNFGRAYRGGLWGFIDRTGTFVAAPQFVAVRDFSEGLAAVAYGSDEKRRWGYVDRTGKIAIKAKYVSATNFKNGVASVRVGDAGRITSFYIKKAGELVPVGEHHKQAADIVAITKRKKKDGAYIYGLAKANGRKLIDEKYDSLEILAPPARGVLVNDGGSTYLRTEFEEGRIYLRAGIQAKQATILGKKTEVDCLYGIVRENGDLITDFDYSYIEAVGEGLVTFAIGGDTSRIPCEFAWQPEGVRLGLLRLFDGSIVAPPQFEKLRRYSDGLAAAKKNGKWGWIDPSGNWVIAPTFDFPSERRSPLLVEGDYRPDVSAVLDIGYFRDGLAYVGDSGYINKAGEYVYEYTPWKDMEFGESSAASEDQNKKMSVAPLVGSAFFVAPNGFAVTNAHVVKGCQEVTDRRTRRIGTVVALDIANDVALLKFSVDNSVTSGALRRTPPPRLGEEVFVFGYPLPGLLSPEGVATNGSVSATSGPGGDARFFQISAPLQSGNSGGPVLDKSGAVIGIAVAKLNALKLAAVTGEVPQNVNFAIKGDYIVSFLNVNGIQYKDAVSNTETKANEDLAYQAKAISLNIECVPMPSGN